MRKTALKMNLIICKCWGKQDKRHIMLHIMVFLKYLRSYGNDASLQKIGQAMVISKGAINDFVIQASQAILKLQKKVIRWPDDKEPDQIGSRIKQENGFVRLLWLR